MNNNITNEYNIKLFQKIMYMVVFYVINFKDDSRKKRMTERFDKLGIDLHFVDPVMEDDPRMDNTGLYKRTSSIMLQHLDSIRNFYENTTAKYCIVCEDDIHISKHLSDHLPSIISDFEELNLDLLLLGYLFPQSSIPGNWHFPVLKSTNKYSYHGYPDDIWGSQMYLISRKHAEYILNTFTIEFGIKNLEVVHYNPDWTITKYGKRAIINPMLAVEEGDDKSNHPGQTDFHQSCHNANYNPDIHM
jgi:GR25 family glycosyltransferase involved in LPS biosynthesis